MINTSTITKASSIVQDFLTFLDYCEKENPELTAANQFLPPESLYELNQQLKMPAENVTSEREQQSYPPIHFYYHLALEAELLEIDYDDDAPQLLTQEDNIHSFRQLSYMVQYLFLLKTYWVHADWQHMTDAETEHVQIEGVDPLIHEIAIGEVGIEYNDQNNEKLLTHLHFLSDEHVTFWNLLGWIKPITGKQSDGKSTHYFSSVSITALGKSIAQLLSTERPFAEWNEPYLEFKMSPGKEGFAARQNEEDGIPFELPRLSENPGLEEITQHFALLERQAKKDLGLDLKLVNLFKTIAEKSYEPSLEEITDLIAKQLAEGKAGSPETEPESFEAVFSGLFEIGETPVLDIKSPLAFMDGQYLFRISLAHDPDVWRIVLLNASHTLAQLHLIIQNAFEFDNEHSYSFFMDNKIRGSRKAINDPRGGQPPFSSDYQLGDLALSPNQRFTYLFNFEDSWEFYIDLLEISTEEMVLPFPKIMEINGEAPNQYGTGREDDYEEEEDDDVF